MLCWDPWTSLKVLQLASTMGRGCDRNPTSDLRIHGHMKAVTVPGPNFEGSISAVFATWLQQCVDGLCQALCQRVDRKMKKMLDCGSSDGRRRRVCGRTIKESTSYIPPQNDNWQCITHPSTQPCAAPCCNKRPSAKAAGVAIGRTSPTSGVSTAHHLLPTPNVGVRIFWRKDSSVAY